jgi:ABC-type branched-subunit amino acid transport system ATPase component
VTGNVTREVDHLSAGYDRAAVVRDLTLALSPGEVVALLGATARARPPRCGPSRA